MIFFVAVLFLLIISGAEFSKPNEFNKDYISRAGTTAIKGIFVILIMFSHGKGYIDVGGKFDVPYLKMQDHLNQMIVAMFMFYSGYGIMESIKKKGSAYIDTIPKKRFPQVLLNMDIAVVLFLILAATAGKFYSVGHILLTLVGWESVGNSNWYIFVILALYVVTYFAFLILKKKNNKATQLIGVIITTVISVAFVYILMKTKTTKQSWWYNTLILYSLGMWYSYFKDKIEKVLMKNDLIFFAASGVLVLAYLEAYNMRSDYGIYSYTVWAVLFTLGIVMITMKVKITNPVLEWFGNHVFSVYILQRIPMILLSRYGVADRHKYELMIASIIVTVLLAEIFDRCTGALSKKIWGRKNTDAKRV